MESTSTRTEEFMKGSFLIIKNSESVSKSTPTVTCISESSRTVKSMVVDSSFGSICPVKTPNKMNSLNTMMANGGAVYPMDKGSISE
jgi:hypothetical protein